MTSVRTWDITFHVSGFGLSGEVRYVVNAADLEEALAKARARAVDDFIVIPDTAPTTIKVDFGEEARDA